MSIYTPVTTPMWGPNAHARTVLYPAEPTTHFSELPCRCYQVSSQKQGPCCAVATIKKGDMINQIAS